MMDASRLRSLVQDKFLSLVIHRSAGDDRTREQLYRQAAREIVREQRLNAKSQTTPFVQTTTATAFETLVSRLWKIVCNQRLHAELMQRRKLPETGNSKITPTIDANPIVCDEPITPAPATNVIPFKPEPAAPLVIAGNGGAKLLNDQEFAAKYHSPVTNAWRQSIEVNERIKREREIRSIQHRNQQSRYIGS
jgi:hypothetical protein